MKPNTTHSFSDKIRWHRMLLSLQRQLQQYACHAAEQIENPDDETPDAWLALSQASEDLANALQWAVEHTGHILQRHWTATQAARRRNDAKHSRHNTEPTLD